jgi:hypothetical protein
MSEMLFYRKIVAVDKDKHRHLRIGAIKDYRFAAESNSVPVAAVEFFEAAREYPIVFTGTSGPTPVPAVLLGLRNNENLFVSESGKWNARYVPAFVRRYPFVLAADNDQLLVCVDEGHPAVGDTGGQAVFTQDGEPTPFLNTAISFMRDFQTETLRTNEFMKRVIELELLTEVSARAELKGGTAHQLGGFSVINETKFRALDAGTVDAFFRKGWLSFIDAHLLSLGNLGPLIDRMKSGKRKLV